MQGRLLSTNLSVQIDTECAHCSQTLALHLDQDLRHKSLSAGADPLVFVPLVDFETLEDPSIIDAF